MKKVLSIIIVFVLMMAGMNGQVFAKLGDNDLIISTNDISSNILEYVNNNYSELINIVKIEPDKYSLTEEQINDLKLGQGFMTYKLDNEDVIPNNIYFFPVLHKNKIVGLINLIDNDGVYTIGYKTGFSKELNKLKGNSFKNPYILVYSDGDLFAINNLKRIIIDKSIIKKNKDNKLSNFDVLHKVKNKDLENKNVTNSAIDEIMTIGDDLPGDGSGADESSTINIPIVLNQDINGGICWAACIASELNYIKGTSYSAVDIYNSYTYDYYTPVSYSNNDKKDIYNSESLSVNYVAEKIGYNSLKNEIINNRPVDSLMYNSIMPNHEVVIRGYYDFDSSSDTASKYISIMDPNNNNYVVYSLQITKKLLSDNICTLNMEISGYSYENQAHYINLQ